MIIIERILLAQDFSKNSKNLVASAIKLAKIFHSEVVPIHVLPNDMVNEKVKSMLKEIATQKLEETIEKLKSAGVKTKEPILAFGSPSNAIVQAAVNSNINLILTGSGEKQQGEKFLLGTTTGRIIQKSEKPVFVVKENVPLKVQRILCSIDFSEASRRALKNAINLTRLWKAELSILSVCELQSSIWFTSEKDKTLENNSRCKKHKANFYKFLDDFDLSNLKCNKEIQIGEPAKEILKTISSNMIDLLVIGAAGMTGLGRLVIGSVTEKIIREVPCSFITLKSENIITEQLENNIRDIEKHFKLAEELLEDGFFDNSIEQFNICLSINNMHVPSHYGLAKVYGKLNDVENAKIYSNSGSDILDRIWDQKIEEEAWKFKSC